MIRVDSVLLERARKLSDKDRNPYAPTLIQIVERGLELALRELEKKKDRSFR
jgi:uncharacterized protein YfbU (UPF0304 family)